MECFHPSKISLQGQLQSGRSFLCPRNKEFVSINYQKLIQIRRTATQGKKLAKVLNLIKEGIWVADKPEKQGQHHDHREMTMPGR